MTNGNNDVRELEDLLTELEGQGALPVGAYAEEDDVVTQLMDAPLGEQEWMVQITPLDRRMMSTEQILAELGTGHLVTRDTLVWRAGMNDWGPASRMDELRSGMGRASAPVTDATLASVPDRRPAPLPPPAPVPPPRVASSASSSPSPLGRVPLPPAPSAPFGAPKPPSPVPDISAASNGLPLMGTAFNALPSNGAFSPPSNGAFSPPSNGAFSSPSNGAFSPPPPPAPGGLMPDLDSAFNLPPAAAVPVPPPVVARVNTQRPVAVDFSEMEPSRSAPLRVLIGSGIAAALMIAGTVYALSAGGVFESTPEPAHAAAASKPAAPSAPAPAAAPKPAEPEAAPAVEAQTQPASVKEAEPPPVVAAEEKAAPEEKMAEKEEPVKAEAETVEPEKPASEKVAAKGEDTDEKPEDEKPEKVKSSKASSDDATGRASRRTKASRTKKASAAEEKEEQPAPRRSKPRAAAVASAAAPAPEASDTKDVPGSTFNRDAAKTALDDASAQARNCRPAGGQSGAGKVQVRYEPNGKVGAVSILSPQFDGTTTGDCVVMVFRRASIPAFTGAPSVVMNKNFEIP